MKKIELWVNVAVSLIYLSSVISCQGIQKNIELRSRSFASDLLIFLSTSLDRRFFFLKQACLVIAQRAEINHFSSLLLLLLVMVVICHY